MSLLSISPYWSESLRCKYLILLCSTLSQTPKTSTWSLSELNQNGGSRKRNLCFQVSKNPKSHDRLSFIAMFSL